MGVLSLWHLLQRCLNSLVEAFAKIVERLATHRSISRKNKIKKLFSLYFARTLKKILCATVALIRPK
uniref:Putative secreted protein n=1 Tax=Ixodes ricinus TaxID=34613 RepID=A0A147BPS5_IXORI